MVGGAEFDQAPVLPDWLRALLADSATATLVDAVVEADIAAAFEHLRNDAEFVELLTDSVSENVTAIHQVAMGTNTLQSLNLTRPRRLAVAQAERRIPQASLQLSYRVGFLTIWRDWIDRVENGAGSDAEKSRGVRLVTELVMAYQNAALAQVATEHTRVEESLQRSREHLRTRLIRDIVSGDHVPDQGDIQSLSYDVDANHLAICVPNSHDGPQSWVRRLRVDCQVSDVLQYVESGGLVTRWFAARHWTADQIRTVGRILADHGVVADISESHLGPDGLRLCHQQLVEIRQVRAALDAESTSPSESPVRLHDIVQHRDVRLEALFLTDRAGAAEFVANELGPLAAPGRTNAVLRETLGVWLSQRGNVATARAMNLHEHTVRNRIRRIEQLLGHPPPDRPAELLLALRLHTLIVGLDERAGHTLPPLESSNVLARSIANSA